MYTEDELRSWVQGHDISGRSAAEMHNMMHLHHLAALR